MAIPVPQMLTANRLRDGAVLWWKNGSWTETLADGQVFSDQAGAEAALAAAQADIKGNKVVAAGRGLIGRLKATTKPVNYHIYFIGDPAGAQVTVTDFLEIAKEPAQ